MLEAMNYKEVDGLLYPELTMPDFPAPDAEPPFAGGSCLGQGLLYCRFL